MTPLYDALWAVYTGKHHDSDEDGIADAAEAELEQDPARYTDDDGSVYRRLGPDELGEASA